MRAVLVSLFAILAIAGCSSNDKLPTLPEPAPTHGDMTWVGTSPAGGGDVVVTIHYINTTLTGRVVFGGPDYRFMTGTGVGDSLHMTLTGGGQLVGRVTGTALGDSLIGTLDLGSGAAPLHARLMPTMSVTTASTATVPFYVYNVAWDGSLLWCANDDHIRTRLDGAIVDTVVVSVRDAHWTATVAGWDGTRMWGVYPLTFLALPDHMENGAELLGYDAHGRTGDSIYVAHRPLGLVYKGGSLWSLRSSPPALLQLDANGHTIDSLHVDLPDATDLAWDGHNFWVLSWYLERLCRVSVDGHVQEMYTLPYDASMSAAGLVFDGNDFVFAETSLGTPMARIHRVLPIYIGPIVSARYAAPATRPALFR